MKIIINRIEKFVAKTHMNLDVVDIFCIKL